MSLGSRARHLLKVHGPRRAAHVIARRLVQGLSPGHVLRTREERRRNRAFDAARGIHTEDIVSLTRLDLEPRQMALGTRYQPVNPLIFESIMAELAIDCRRASFIDLGSGMGRALVLAAEHPFQRIVGVEFARELHEVAESNLGALKQSGRTYPPIDLHCIDAGRFVFPAGELVVFLYNPFQREICERVVQNLERSHAANPRPMRVIYIDPEHGSTFAESPLFRTIRRERQWQVFASCNDESKH